MCTKSVDTKKFTEIIGSRLVTFTNAYRTE